LEGDTTMSLTKKEKKIEQKHLAEEQREISMQHAFMKKYFKKKMEGAEKYDQYVSKDYDKVLLTAKTTFGVTDDEVNEFSPLVVSMPEAFYKGSNLSIKMGKKQDKIRYNQSRLTVLLFGETQLYYYQTLVDHQTSSFSDNHALELPYQAIMSIESKSSRYFSKKAFHHFVDLQLNLVNNQVINLRLKNIIKKESELKQGAIITKDIQDVLKDLLVFLRKKRGL